MNIYDISREAGVSIATVSRVINGNVTVSPKTKEKVLKVIKDNDYKPNVFARGLGLDSMRTIGILCADSSDPYMAQGIYFLEQNLRQNHYDVLLCCTGYQVEAKEKYMDLLISKRMDAIILLGSNFVEKDDKDNDYIRRAASILPILIINGSLNGKNIYSCACNDYQSTFNATQVLIDSGHRNIHFLYNSNSFSGHQKMKGFLNAMARIQNKNSLKQHIHFVPGSIQESKDYLTNLYSKKQDMTAIISSDDALAVGALKFASSINLSVPKQLAVIGYNNSILSTCCEPELTSIDSQISILCDKGIKTLISVLNQQPAQQLNLIPGQLVERGSFYEIR